MASTIGNGQMYFNERYQLSPRYSATTTIAAVPGGYWIAGVAFDGPSQIPQSLLLQALDSSGQPRGAVKRWTAPNTVYYSCYGNSLLPLPDGSMTLTGNSEHRVNGRRVVWGNLWRFTPQGDTLWMRTYAAPPNVSVTPRGGCRLPDGGYALVGEYYDPASSTITDVLLLRTDSLGHELWRRTYHHGWFDNGIYALPTADGGLLISGATFPFSAGFRVEGDGLLLKVDSLGLEQWRTTFGGSWLDMGGPVLATPDGGYVMGGTSSNSIGPFDQWETRPTLFWFDSVGTLLRERAYGEPRDAMENYFLLPVADGYVLGGQTTEFTNPASPDQSYPVGFLLRVCADGDSVWYRTYRNLTGGTSHNYLRDVKQAPDGGFVGAGFLFARAPDTGPTSAWVFKTDADGYLQAGGAPPTMVCTPVGLPAEVEATQTEVWPNPAPNGRYTVRAAGAVAYAVHDALGRRVAHGPVREPETPLTLTAQPAGVYVLRLTWPDGRTVTTRLLR